MEYIVDIYFVDLAGLGKFQSVVINAEGICDHVQNFKQNTEYVKARFTYTGDIWNIYSALCTSGVLYKSIMVDDMRYSDRYRR